MKLLNKKSIPTLVVVTALGLISVAVPKTFADTTETTVRTTTVTTENAIVPDAVAYTLPATHDYLIIDPLTGALKGSYDAADPAVSALFFKPGFVIVEKDSGRLVASVGPLGHLVDAAAVPAESTFVAVIDARRHNLDRWITEAFRNGQLTESQAKDMRTELDHIYSQELAVVPASPMSYERALEVASALNSLSDRLVAYDQAVVVSPMVAPQLVAANGHLVYVDEYSFKKSKIDARMSTEYAAGRLSGTQLADLKDRLDSIEIQNARLRRDGEMSANKERDLCVQLDRVQARMDRDVALINDKRARMGLTVY